ncbi:hypothetical protein LCGC14_2539500, partial [marine sediment metagenome]
PATSGPPQPRQSELFDPLASSLRTTLALKNICPWSLATCEELVTASTRLSTLPPPLWAQDILDGGSGYMLTLTVHGNNNRKGLSKKSGGGLAATVRKRYAPTLLARDSRTLRGAKRSPTSLGTHPLAHEIGARAGFPPGGLNPLWCEWFMGFPIGWTALEPLGKRNFRSWQQQHGAS